MAITKVQGPSTYARVNDTNRMTYVFSSSNYTQANFQFQFRLYKWDISGTQINLGYFNMHPKNDGTVEFNPSTIYKSYLSYDFNASETGLEEAINMGSSFSLSVYEVYGTPPTVKNTGQWTGELGQFTPMKIYNGCQQNIPYDYIPLNTKGNMKWVMSGSTSGQFLTDATEYRLDNNEIAFLYFLGDRIYGRPNKIRYTIYYRCYGSGGDPTDNPTWLGISKDLNIESLQQGVPNTTGEINLDEDAIQPPTGPWTGICYTYTYDTNISYQWNNSFSFYFPIGPHQLINNSAVLAPYKDTWTYYKVDIMTGTTVLNSQPFYVYRDEKCNKYGRWQLFWLNIHGGFDTYTFDRKVFDDFKYDRTTYKQKLPYSSYSTYDAGERIFNVDVTEEITLHSKSLTQRESQILMGLVQSPRVYAITMYNYGGGIYPYGVPYIVVSNEMRYGQKKNDKEIFMEIKIRPSNQRIVQGD